MLSELYKAEIRKEYRLAADKKKQISILADLYGCRISEIREVLELDAPAKDDIQPYQKAIKTGGKQKSYSQAIKDDVVKAVLFSGLTQAAAAERYGIPFQTVSTWVKKTKQIRDEFISEAKGFENKAKLIAKDLPPVTATHSLPMVDVENNSLNNKAKKCTTINLEFEASIIDAEIDRGLSSLKSALYILEKMQLVDGELKEKLTLLGIRAEAFRAGVMYAATIAEG